MGRAYEVRKFKMEKSSQAKTKVYSKYGREIYVAAKSGQDPNMKAELQRVIEKAKKEQVPNDIIERAIKKATSNDTEHYDHVIYEGFAQGGSNIILQTLTDNTNRTYSEIRAILNKTGGKLGVNGSVMHQFRHVALFEISGLNEEEVLELLLNNDIEPQDIRFEGDVVEIEFEIKDYAVAKKALADKCNIISADLTYIPLTQVELNSEELEIFQKMYNMLEDLDDVQEIYHNVK